MIGNDDFSLMNRDMRSSFASGVNQSYEARLSNLEAIRNSIKFHYDEACEALFQDLGRSKTEARVELEIVLSEITLVMSHLKVWVEPKKKSTHMMLAPARTEVRREPYGIVLIIGAFCYPIQHCLLPLIGAIAAGNCVVIKPSDQASCSASWLLNKFSMCLSKQVVRVVNGDHARTQRLLCQPFDFIFFTGTAHGARVVSHAAAQYLTPLCLQLGGKSPSYVDETCSTSSIETVAKRIVQGKFHNCGQSCLALDYVLVHEAVHENLIRAVIKYTSEFYSTQPELSEDYGRIINVANTKRLKKLILTSGGKVIHPPIGTNKKNTPSDPLSAQVPDSVIEEPFLSTNRETKGVTQMNNLDPASLSASVSPPPVPPVPLSPPIPMKREDFQTLCNPPMDSNEVGQEDRYIPPTIIDQPSLNSQLMKQEIFGPILPIVKVKSDEEVVRLINEIDSQPFTCFHFTSKSNAVLNRTSPFLSCVTMSTKEEREKETESSSSMIRAGSVIVNDTLVYTSQVNHQMPWGGSGGGGGVVLSGDSGGGGGGSGSGYGSFRGESSFMMFSRPRGIVYKHHSYDIDKLLLPFGSIRYPPNNKMRERMLPYCIRYLPSIPVPFQSKSFVYLGQLCMLIYFVVLVWRAEQSNETLMTCLINSC